MTESSGKISVLQACMILLLMNGLTNHVIVNPMLLDASGRDAWISVIGAGIIFIPWCLLLFVFMKKSQQQKLQPWLAEHTHPAISWLLTIPLCVQLYLIGGMTIVHTATWTISNYLPATPKLVLVITLSILCALCASWGIRAIAITSGILLPIVMLLGIFASVSNYSEKNLHLLKPFIEYGWNPVFTGMIYAGGGFVELIVLIAMQHRLQSKIRAWPLIIYGLISIYIMLGPLIGAITEFGPYEAAKQMVSPYEQWRLVKLGSYVEHLDFFSVYQWLAGASIRISLSIFLLIELLPLSETRLRNRFIMMITVSYILLSMLPINEYSFYSWMYRLYFPVSLAVAFAVSVAWVFISLFAKPSKGGKSIT
ncbi:endospore germination permease [Cohnella silvisoli]|uniref:Endospore germination permease n=1 Tax=Cohnella silvisoli TaxID=2873699 RepID=A0ABV1KQ98_9BACL|nr:endospore germination permease [Cohnella silvisoli]MCD9020921.1 endospore germination permease [Cohnella silvisoli]